MNCADWLDADGPLSERIDGFAPRPQQRAMAEAVEAALDQRATLVVEAGTGTGKTFAYLVPVLLSGLKVVISTGTRNLQDQLFHRDLPVVRDALGLPRSVALLKGRANYLCRHRLATSAREGRFASREQAHEFGLIRAWAGRTTGGDIGEVAGVPEQSGIWPRVTSTVDNCLGPECPDYQDCHLVQARRRAQEAEVVVINHHLLLADMAMRDDGFGELLPAADAFVVDEAHQFAETARQFFGISLSGRQLLELARDAIAEQLSEAPEVAAIRDAAAVLEQRVATLRLALGTADGRGAWREASTRPQVREALDTLAAALGALREALSGSAHRGKGLGHCLTRSESAMERLRAFDEGEDGGERVRWFETQGRGFSLNLTPLEVDRQLRDYRETHPAAWVFTSATLAVGGTFDHFCERLGLSRPATLRLDSPFDYARNALLYHPESMPDPASQHYVEALVQALVPVLEASRGRAFVLFTSHQALKEAAARLEGRLAYPLLVQGERSKAELLARFRALGNAVLLGTASFWEGVDVRGEALSCVVIAKFPFASPGDPVEQARIEALRSRGGNPFMEYQLPHAVIVLKQGVGRLIRDVTDRGVLMLCDPRLLSRPYGRVFLDSLPPMPRTRRLERVQRFFETRTP